MSRPSRLRPDIDDHVASWPTAGGDGACPDRRRTGRRATTMAALMIPIVAQGGTGDQARARSPRGSHPSRHHAELAALSLATKSP